MTVAQLIIKLCEFDPKMEVKVPNVENEFVDIYSIKTEKYPQNIHALDRREVVVIT